MSTLPRDPNDPPNPPDVVVENVLGAQVGNPPILPIEGEEEVVTEIPPGDLPPLPEEPQ